MLENKSCGTRLLHSFCFLSESADGLFNRNRAAEFLAIAFAGQRRFQAGFFAGRDIEGMAFDFTNDVFRLYLAFEAAERAFQRLVIAEFHFCQFNFTCLSLMAILGF